VELPESPEDPEPPARPTPDRPGGNGRRLLIAEPAYVKAIGLSLQQRYVGAAEGEAMDAFLDDQAAKRVAVRIDVQRVASWDHRKLGGGY